MKNQAFYLLLSITAINLGNFSHAKPSILHLAKASQEVYQDEENGFSNYEPVDKLLAGGFKVSAYYDARSDDRIIAFRGSVNASNWYFNGTHIFEAVRGKCASERQLDYFTESILTLSRFFTEHQNPSTMVTGHSLGGFLAQYFAKYYQVGGASFNAPALGEYSLKDHNSLRSLRDRYNSVQLSLSASISLNVLTSILGPTHRMIRSSGLAMEPIYESWSRSEVVAFKYRDFFNHRLKGDPVSKFANKKNQSKNKGYYGSTIDHNHSFWNEVYPNLSGMIKLHSIDFVVKHFESWGCEHKSCQNIN